MKTIRRTSKRVEEPCSGNPAIAVPIACACTSGPAISSSPEVGVGCRSWRTWDEAPMTTILSRKNPRGIFLLNRRPSVPGTVSARYTSEYRTWGTVAGGP
jgi:hypothetical protein